MAFIASQNDVAKFDKADPIWKEKEISCDFFCHGMSVLMTQSQFTAGGTGRRCLCGRACSVGRGRNSPTSVACTRCLRIIIDTIENMHATN